MQLSDYRIIKINNTLSVGEDPFFVFKDDLSLILKILYDSLRYNIYIDIQDWISIHDHASSITSLDKSLIRKYLNKMLKTKNKILTLEKLRLSGLLRHLIPELITLMTDPYCFHYNLSNENDSWVQTLLFVNDLPDNTKLDVIWAGVLLMIDDDYTVLKRLGYNSKFIQSVIEVKNQSICVEIT